jgi:hypothetical protein
MASAISWLVKPAQMLACGAAKVGCVAWQTPPPVCRGRRAGTACLRTALAEARDPRMHKKSEGYGRIFSNRTESRSDVW